MRSTKLAIIGVGITLIAAPSVLWCQQNEPNAAPSASPSATPMAPTGPAPAGPPAGAVPAGSVPAAASSGDTTAPPDLEHRNPRYKIQRDDVLSITFPLSPEFDQPRITVQPDGYITLQDVGSIFVQDLTTPQLVEAIKKAYAGTLHDPIIDVDLIDFQRPYFLVSGQVGKPGQYDLRHDTTVSEAIAIAGGLTPGAKTQVFVFHRVSSDWVEVRKLSIKELYAGKKAQEDAYLSPGDQVFIPEKFITKFRKYVPYGIGTSVGAGFY
jgi:polysaccharide biosynthesis/export protein